MYWLYNSEQQRIIREQVENLVRELSQVDNSPSQQDQLFPFVGRKDRRKANVVICQLTKDEDVVCDPFAGSGILAYSAFQNKRNILANEFEIYTNRMSNAPWKIPVDQNALNNAYAELNSIVKGKFDSLYQTKCVCGNLHVIDSLFFDRVPLEFRNITTHERLGKKGENITYRKKYKCQNCGATEKHFDDFDEAILNRINSMAISEKFNAELIENSRINLSKDFLVYSNLFPKRSMVALDTLYNAIEGLNTSVSNKEFLFDVFLSIIPQAKYKDYRSKSQDLHCPNVQLREVNLLHRFQQQFESRLSGLRSYGFTSLDNPPIKCCDFRDFMVEIEDSTVDMIFTDPPWGDGNAYFEKAQLYHPWLNYSLLNDKIRLSKEVVITDAPSRKNIHDENRWWQDIDEFFKLSSAKLKTDKYLALMFRPIKASKWLEVLNRLKFIARAAGFEPLLTIDIGSADPSMRIQQSACYAFVDDLIILFIKLPETLQRFIFEDHDIDQIVFQNAEILQEELSSSFSYRQWRSKISLEFNNRGLHNLNLPKYEDLIFDIFNRYCDQVEPHKYLTKHLTPFSGQLFDVPATERIFTYIPKVVNDLLEKNNRFSYSEFLLKLSQYLENGTRSLIQQISELDMSNLLETYAERIADTKYFRRKELPALPKDIKKIMDLNPYEFEIFVGHLLKAQGFSNVVIAGRSGDRGVDLIADDPNGQKTIVQCKQWGTNNVGSTPVQRLDSFARTRKAKRKILITSSNFTTQGLDEASITGTETVNGEQLLEMVAIYMPNFYSN